MDDREAVVWAVLQNKQLSEELERIREERDMYLVLWRQAAKKEASENESVSDQTRD